MQSLCVHPVPQWISSGGSGFLPQSKNCLVTIETRQHGDSGFGQDFSVQSLSVLPVPKWVSSRCSGFVPQPKDMGSNVNS